MWIYWWVQCSDIWSCGNAHHSLFTTRILDRSYSIALLDQRFYFRYSKNWCLTETKVFDWCQNKKIAEHPIEERHRTTWKRIWSIQPHFRYKKAPRTQNKLRYRFSKVWNWWPRCWKRNLKNKKTLKNSVNSLISPITIKWFNWKRLISSR